MRGSRILVVLAFLTSLFVSTGVGRGERLSRRVLRTVTATVVGGALLCSVCAPARAQDADAARFIAPGRYANPRTMLQDYAAQAWGFTGDPPPPAPRKPVPRADILRRVLRVHEDPLRTTEHTLKIGEVDATGARVLRARVLFAGPGATPERVRAIVAQLEQQLSKPGEYRLTLEPGTDHFVFLDPERQGHPFMSFGTFGERFVDLPTYVRDAHDWTSWAAGHEGLHLFYGIPDSYVRRANHPLGFEPLPGYERQLSGNRGATGLPTLKEIVDQNRQE